MTPTKKRSTFATIVCAALSIPSAQCEFTMPRSDLKDNQQQFTTGDILPIVWNSGWKNGLYDQPERVDLWVTWFYQDGYKVKLKCTFALFSFFPLFVVFRLLCWLKRREANEIFSQYNVE
jgi:hypothetical protein